MDKKDNLNAALDPAVVAKIAAHYRHARAKHPYFADRILDNFDGGVHTALAVKATADDLATKRAYVETELFDGMVKPITLLECEMAEVHESYARGDKAHAVEECYDAIAVLLRMVDVLEGRQALGDPAKKAAIGRRKAARDEDILTVPSRDEPDAEIAKAKDATECALRKR